MYKSILIFMALQSFYIIRSVPDKISTDCHTTSHLQICHRRQDEKYDPLLEWNHRSSLGLDHCSGYNYRPLYGCLQLCCSLTSHICRLSATYGSIAILLKEESDLSWISKTWFFKSVLLLKLWYYIYAIFGIQHPLLHPVR